MAQVRKIAALSVLTTIGAVLALWVSVGLWAMLKGPAWVSEQLRKRGGIEATVGSIRTNFVTTLSLRDVHVSSPAKGRLEELRFSVRPWDLLSLRSHDRHIFRMTLVRPDVEISERGGPPPAKRSGPFQIIPFGATVQDGRLRIHRDDKTWEVNHLNAFLGATPFGWDGKATGEVPDVGHLTATIRSGWGEARNWEASVESERLRISNIAGLLPAFTANIGEVTGVIGAKLTLKGTMRERVAISDWKVIARSQGATWKREGSGSPVPLSGEIEASANLLRFKTVKVGRGTVIDGTVAQPWRTPEMKLSAKLSGQPVEDLVRYWRTSAGPVAGELSAEVQVSGHPRVPRVEGTYSFAGSVGQLRLPHTQGSIALVDGQLESTTTFGGARLRISGTGVAGLGPVWSVNASGLSLADIGKENKWSNIDGTLSARFLVRGQNPVVTGRIDASPIRWGRLRFAGTHGGSVRFTRDELVVRADDGSIAVTAFRNGPLIDLQTLTLALAGAGNVSAKGKVNLGSRGLDLDAQIEGVSADVWPPLVSRYPDITGALSARGRLQGTIEAPAGDFDLAWTDLRFRTNGRGYSGQGIVRLEGDDVAIRQAQWADGYHGEAAWHRAQKRWDARLELREASPQFLWDLARGSVPVGGTISGTIEAKGGTETVATSSLTWSNGNVGGFAFDRFGAALDWKGNEANVQEASLVRGSQAIRGQAQLTRRPAGWSFEALAQVQRWGPAPLTIDGEVEAEGVLNMADSTLDAKLTAPVFWLSDRALDDLSAQVRLTPQRLTVAGRSTDQAVFSFSVDRATERLSGKFTARDLQLQGVFPQPAESADSAAPGPPTGAYDLEATVAGTVAAPSARIKASVQKATWRLETFSAKATLDVNRSTLTVVSAEASLEAGGKVNASGTIVLGKGGSARIEGAGTEVDLQAIFHLLWWPVRWEGVSDTTFVITKSDGPLSTVVRFDGDHDGFGPFREGGGVRGEITGYDREWKLGGLLVESGDGYLQLREGSKLYFDKSGAATMRMVADVRNLRTGALTMFGGLEMVGRWKGDPGATGGRRIDMDVFARSLWINQFVLDGNVTHMAVEGKRIDFSPIPGSGQQLSGSLSYDKYPDLFVTDFRFLEGGKERLVLSGNIGTRLWDFNLRARRLDASVVRGLLDTSLSMTGPMDLDVVGRGSPAAPDIEADVKWFDGRIGALPLDQAEGRFSYKSGDIRLRDFVVQKKNGYQMQGSARLGVGPARDQIPLEVDVKLEKGDLALLEEMSADVSKAGGSFDGALRIGGPAGTGAIAGFLNVQKMAVRSAYTPDLDRGEVRVRFEKDRLLIDRASARLGEGQVVAGGHVLFANGRASHYDLYLKSEGSRGASIRVPQLAIAPGPVLGRFKLLGKKLAGISRGEPLVDLTFKGPAESPTVAGTVLLENTVFTYPPQKGGESNTWWRRYRQRLRWDIALNAGRRTWYQNELVDATVAGTIQMKGPESDLYVNGKILSDQGSIVYSGNEFRIKDAELEIETRRPTIATERKQTVVYLKATAEKEVFYTDAFANSNNDVIVMVVPRAPLGEIQPRFYAKNNPNLSSQRALQLALGLPFGESIENSSLLPDQRTQASDQADTDKFLRLGLVQLLDSSLASPLARALARNTGLVDFVRVTYQENDPHADVGIPELDDRSAGTDVTDNEVLKFAKGTKVRFGRGLGRRLFADYSFRVDEFESELNLRHELELAYRVHRNLFLRGTSELDRERELGRPPDRRAILENQWRFGLPRRRSNPAHSPANGAGTTPSGGD